MLYQSHKLEFEIITRDRDNKSEKPYTSIKSNQWNKIKNTKKANDKNMSCYKLTEFFGREVSFGKPVLLHSAHASYPNINKCTQR